MSSETVNLDLQQQNVLLQSEVTKLKQEKRQLEEDFQQKRSKFKEMYYAKENSIQELNTQLLQAKSKLNENEAVVKSLKAEIEDIKVVASVSESTKQEAVENLRTNHQQEIDSLQKVLEDTMEERNNDLLQQFEMERKQWEREKKQLLRQIHHHHSDEEEDDLKIKQEQLDAANMIRSVSVPLENEILMLKNKLRRAEKNSQSCDESNQTAGASSREDSSNIKQHVLVLEQENETLKRKMHEVCRMLEREKCEHEKLIRQSSEASLLNCKGDGDEGESEKLASSSSVASATDDDATGRTGESVVIGGEESSACLPKRHESSPTDSTEFGPNVGESTTYQHQNDLQEKAELWKSRFDEERKLRFELEQAVAVTNENNESQIRELNNKIVEFQQVLHDLKTYQQKKESSDDKRLSHLMRSHDQLKDNLTIVTRERDVIRHSYDKNRQQVDEEVSSTANTLQDLRTAVRRYKDALVAAQTDKSEVESKLSFLQSQLSATQHSKDQIENALSSEIDLLQAKLSSLQNMKNQFEQAISEKNNLQMKIEQEQLQANSIRTKSKEVIQSLRDKLNNEIASKEQAVENLASVKNQVRSLQESLETSEQVQRDFVKLSQSLQVQLENIRVNEEKKKEEAEVDPSTTASATN